MAQVVSNVVSRGGKNSHNNFFKYLILYHSNLGCRNLEKG